VPTPTIPFDAFTLAAVAAELRHALTGARVQKVQQPSEHELILSAYGRAGAQRLLLSADPKSFRIHLTQVKRENPVTPPAFCQLCRKQLEGAFVEAVTLPRFDRVLHLWFRAHDGERVRLVAELMGRNANLVLVSGAGLVRGTIRTAPADSDRALRPGKEYTDPPGFHDRIDPLSLSGPDDRVFADVPDDPGEARVWLTSTFSGIGRFGADEIMARAEGDLGRIPDALCGLMSDVGAERFSPRTIGGAEDETVGVWAFEPLTVPAGRRHVRESISVALDTFYATLTGRGVDQSERAAVSRALSKEIAYRRKEIAAARATLAEAHRAEGYERLGNTLLAHLARIERGAASITLPDLYADDARDVTIVLDPKRSPQENAEGYFARARKARDAAEYARTRAAEMSEQLTTLEGLAAGLDRPGDGADTAAIRKSLSDVVGAERAGAPAAQRRPEARNAPRPFGGHRIRTYTVEGYTLLVGETAEANDYVTTRVAAPTDLWMHVRSAHGAHGVLRTNGRPDRVPDTVIRRAAGIVAARSGTAVKHSGLVAVDVTEKRYVRKPRGAKPGLVVIQRERSIDVSPIL
jgi:predicted ribosome quality control (RQC) complex YloA/Tae2 family protein